MNFSDKLEAVEKEEIERFRGLLRKGIASRALELGLISTPVTTAKAVVAEATQSFPTPTNVKAPVVITDVKTEAAAVAPARKLGISTKMPINFLRAQLAEINAVPAGTDVDFGLIKKVQFTLGQYFEGMWANPDQSDQTPWVDLFAAMRRVDEQGGYILHQDCNLKEVFKVAPEEETRRWVFGADGEQGMISKIIVRVGACADNADDMRRILGAVGTLLPAIWFTTHQIPDTSVWAFTEVQYDLIERLHHMLEKKKVTGFVVKSLQDLLALPAVPAIPSGLTTESFKKAKKSKAEKTNGSAAVIVNNTMAEQLTGVKIGQVTQ